MSRSHSTAHRGLRAGIIAGALAGSLVLGTQPAYAIGTDVDLGTATTYSVLGGQSVTNTGPTVLSGDLGVNPGTAISGFPPGTFGGTLHQTDAHPLQAQSDLTVAYDNAAGQASDATVAGDLGGLTLLPGVYTSASTLEVTGALTLDAQGDPDAVFIFQIGSTLTTATDSSVVMLGGASSCNVFWQVSESATIGTNTDFIGTIMALTSITVNNGATVAGRALARNGSVTLDNNVFTDDGCGATPTVVPPVAPPVVVPPVVAPPAEPVVPPAVAPVVVPEAPAAPTPTEAPVAPTPVSVIESPVPTDRSAANVTALEEKPTLPVTGSNPAMLVGSAIVLVLLGSALLAVRARSRHV